MLASIAALYLSGALMCLFLLWRDSRFRVQLPHYEPDDFMCALAAWSLRLAISTYWPAFVFLEAAVHKRARGD